MSHAPEGWTAPRSFEQLLDPHPASISGLVELVPQFSLLVEDLAHLSNDELRARTLAVFPKLALWLLRDACDGDRLLESLDIWATAFAEALAARNGSASFAHLLR